MTGCYELRVWGSGVRTAGSPHRVESFVAADDVSALERMERFAADLKVFEDVWLYRAGGNRSIGSTSGSAP